MLLEAALRTAKTDYRRPAALASISAPGLTVPARALPLWQPCQPSSAPAQQPAVPGRAPSLRELPLPWLAVPAHCRVIPVSGALCTYSKYHTTQHSDVAIHTAKAMSAFVCSSSAACLCQDALHLHGSFLCLSVLLLLPARCSQSQAPSVLTADIMPHSAVMSLYTL